MAKRSTHGHSTLYWVVFAVCAAVSFAGGFFYTYHATSQVAIKNPNTNESFFQGAVLPEAVPSETPIPEPTATPYQDPFAEDSVTPSPRAIASRTPRPKETPWPKETPYVEVYTPAPSVRATPSSQVYRVQVGAYDTKDAAQSMVDELLSAGIAASVVLDQGQYHAQIGAYSSRDRALTVADDINAQGYSVTIRK